jgi:hypothetical protein
MVTPTFEMFVQYPAWATFIIVEKIRRKVCRTDAFQSFRRHFHLSSPPINRPIFVIGTVRSGKTTLARCLDNHPRIVYLGRELATEWCDLADIEIARSNNNKAHCPPYTEIEATKTICDRVGDGFADMLARNGGGSKNRFLDDNPHLWNKLPFVRQIFPDAQLLVASRSIRSTVASAKCLWIKSNAVTGKKFYFPENHAHCWSVIPPASLDGVDSRRIFPGGDVAVLAEYWLRTYSEIEEAMKKFDVVVLVKQSALLADTTAMISDIYDAINVPQIRCPVPNLNAARIDPWQEILTQQEQQNLEEFIECNRSRIERLLCADTTL